MMTTMAALMGTLPSPWAWARARSRGGPWAWPWWVAHRVHAHPVHHPGVLHLPGQAQTWLGRAFKHAPAPPPGVGDAGAAADGQGEEDDVFGPGPSRIIASGLLQNVAELCIIDRDYRLHLGERELPGHPGAHRGRLPGAALLPRCSAIPRPRAPAARRQAVLDSSRPCAVEKDVRLPRGRCLRKQIDAFPVYDADRNLSYVLKMGRPPPRRRTARRRTPGPPRPPPPSPSGSGRSCAWWPRAAPTTRSAGAWASAQHTVKTHVASIFNKLGVGSRAEATLRAARLNIVQ